MLSPPDTAVSSAQFRRFESLWREVVSRPFYREHFAGYGIGNNTAAPTSIEQLRALPLLDKPLIQFKQPLDQKTESATELAGRIFDLPRDRYVRFHQTSGTTGRPMVVLDTAADWTWWLDCWDAVLDAADVTARDTAMMAFSFGPFIGFWTASEAMTRRGTLTIPGGGLSSRARLRLIVEQRCSVVCCTPTYAMHLSEIAAAENIDLPSTAVNRLIVAGEPGGSVPAIRQVIEKAWGARVIDHAGGSEIGAWGYGNKDATGLIVNEQQFIAEIIDPATCQPVGENVSGELVLTGLGRIGGPAIRYRTGDLVRGVRDAAGRLLLVGGIEGRIDDMVVIRGVNVFPASIEAIVRRVHPTAEFRIHVRRVASMDQINIQIEGDASLAYRLANELRSGLALRVDVEPVDVESLPRFEAKAKRMIRHD